MDDDLELIARFGRMEFDFFKQSFRFQIVDAFNVTYTNTQGASYAEYEERKVDDMVFTSEEVDEEGGYQAVKEYLEKELQLHQMGKFNLERGKT